MTFLSTAEWCAVVVPVVLYWTFSGLLYFLSRMNFTSVNLHKISYDGRPQNKVSEKEVLVAVVTQHLLQMSLAAVLTSLMREGTKEGMEEWWLVVIKIVLGVIFMDTYQVGTLQQISVQALSQCSSSLVLSLCIWSPLQSSFGRSRIGYHGRWNSRSPFEYASLDQLCVLFPGHLEDGR
eukprot:TRINITY_DN1532_c0_g1_i3.p1 TRINITY_DN1532_c0_g1~~TRINITY_DN1532_c0_g1_i3.p1  ORF type:complete len:179 (+),score=16.54 TRINITY_DN1532_c0_g1_i3:100-636(+)